MTVAAPSAIYSLADAAAYIGIPVDQLHQMSWANFGPKPVAKSYWSPEFTRDELDAYLALYPAKPVNSVPVVKPGVWAVKRMRVRG